MSPADADGVHAPPADSDVVTCATERGAGSAVRPLRVSPRFATGSTPLWGRPPVEPRAAARTPLSSLAHSFDDLDMVSPLSGGSRGFARGSRGASGCAVGDAAADDDAERLESAKRKAGNGLGGPHSPAIAPLNDGAIARISAGTAPKRSRRAHADSEADGARAGGLQRRSLRAAGGGGDADTGGRWSAAD